MSHYRVTWDIDLEASTPEMAARKALEIQRNPESTATVFDVSERVKNQWATPVMVDLLPEDEA